MILYINGNYPEIPEDLSPDVHALIFSLLDLISRVYASQTLNRMDPDEAVAATIAFARERHPEISSKSPEELAAILQQRRLTIPR